MNVTMPDGTVVQNVPEGITRAQLTQKLQAAGHTVPPPAAAGPPPIGGVPAPNDPSVPHVAPDPSAGRLGPTASGLVRGPLEGLAGIATAIPDAATSIGNLAGGGIDKLLGIQEPDVQSPGGMVQDLIDKFTTAPTTRMGKGLETANAALYGSLAGPKAPHVPRGQPGVSRLAREGVTMTPGQRAGGLGNSLEEKVGAIIPPIKNARGKAVEQWNTARLNDALSDAKGKPVPKDMTGTDALRHTYQEMQARYTQVISKMKAVLGQGPGSFRDSVNKVKQVGQNLDPSQRKTLSRILDDQVIGKFTVGGRASGTTAKEIGETLRTEADKHRTGGYQDRQVAQALDQVRTDLRSMLVKENPKHGPELLSIDKGYAKYKTSAKAANYSATKGGQSTTGQRLQAIRARDKSKDKNAFATGTAPGQGEATEAQGVLGNTQPDSGTPMGMALLDLPKSVIGAAVGAPLIYNQPMLKFLQDRALSSDPELLSNLGIVGGVQQSQQESAQ
jgi:hypothetical protein